MSPKWWHVLVVWFILPYSILSLKSLNSSVLFFVFLGVVRGSLWTKNQTVSDCSVPLFGQIKNLNVCIHMWLIKHLIPAPPALICSSNSLNFPGFRLSPRLWNLAAGICTHWAPRALCKPEHWGWLIRPGTQSAQVHPEGFGWGWMQGLVQASELLPKAAVHGAGFKAQLGRRRQSKICCLRVQKIELFLENYCLLYH